MKTNSAIPTVTLHITIFFWACGALFAKIIDLPAAEIIYLRTIPGLLVLTLVALLLKNSFVFPLRDWLAGILTGMLTIGHWVTFYQSVQMSTVALGLITLYTYPLITTLAEAAIHRTRPNRLQILLALFGLVGIMLVSFQSLTNGFSLLAVGLGLFSAVLFTGRNLSSKYLAHHVPSIMQMWMQLFAGLIALSFIFGPAPVFNTSADNWLLISLLGVVFVALPHSAYLFALKHIGASQAALMGMIQPIYAIILAILILNEYPGVLEIFGGMIILSAATLATIDTMNKSRRSLNPPA